MIPLIVAASAGAIAGAACLEGYYRVGRKPKPHVRAEIAERIRAALDWSLTKGSGLDTASMQDLRDARSVHSQAVYRLDQEIGNRRADNRRNQGRVRPSIKDTQ